MIVLDTNVLSGIMRVQPDKAVAAWLDRQIPHRLCITTITVFEARTGIARMAEGRRRDELEAALARVIYRHLGGRVLDFDTVAAEAAADIAAARHRRGINIDFRDTAIAAIAIAHGASLATRNRRHFADLDLPLHDPWTD